MSEQIKAGYGYKIVRPGEWSKPGDEKLDLNKWVPTNQVCEVLVLPHDIPIRRPVDPQEGWEIVPARTPQTQDMEFTDDGKTWHTSSLLVDDYKSILAFRRRKQPADGWIKVSEQLPPGGVPIYVVKQGVVYHWKHRSQHNGLEDYMACGITHWQPAPRYPAPPAPEKSDAEKAWELYLEKWPSATSKVAFVNGFSAGRAAK